MSLKEKFESGTTGKDTIRLAGVARESIVDGPGLRFTVFCQGCPHRCPGCHNSVTWSFDGGKDTPISKILDAIDENPLLDGVTFSGGEPVMQAGGFANLAEEIKKRGLNIYMYSGYLLEELLEMAKSDSNLTRLLKLTDVLVDGRYIDELRDLTLKFRGSSNQRLIDMPSTLSSGRVSLVDDSNAFIIGNP